jgi:hypothetical protein
LDIDGIGEAVCEGECQQREEHDRQQIAETLTTDDVDIHIPRCREGHHQDDRGVDQSVRIERNGTHVH